MDSGTLTFEGYKLSPNGTTRRAIYYGPEEVVTERIELSSISSLSSFSSVIGEISEIDAKPCLGDEVSVKWSAAVKWKHPRARCHDGFRDDDIYRVKVVGISIKNGNLFYECQWQDQGWYENIHNIIAPESYISTAVENDE